MCGDVQLGEGGGGSVHLPLQRNVISSPGLKGWWREEWLRGVTEKGVVEGEWCGREGVVEGEWLRGCG